MSRLQRQKRSLPVLLGMVALVGASPAFGQELPKPTIYNSTIVSIEHSPQDAAAVASIKSSLPFGLYAWLSFSVTHVDPALDWSSDWSLADAGIQSFKNSVNGHIAAAKAAGVRFHLVACSGLGRGLPIYEAAKQEDIRNAQWYNDNAIASNGQVLEADYLNQRVFGTYSRYARKLRRNLTAKGRAMMAFLKQRMDEEPGTLAAFSAWGEAELNYGRLAEGLIGGYPKYFADYSPFAVLEFRDWIQHGGLYDDATGIYAGQGYSGGGAKYAGDAGLAQFNADFGTAFASWNLRYFNWSLADGETAGAIPIGAYVQGGMMPADGAHFIAGGFDPPRAVQPGNAFWDLWNMFREKMVRNLLLDLGQWAQEAGVDPDRWFTHQIPGDYLFGTSPASEPKNERYYSSASPSWTADIRPRGSVGATVYDVKYDGWFARTSENLLPAAAELGSRWAMMEYDAEAYPIGYGISQSPSDVILAQYLRAYSYRPSLINFWRWVDGTGESQIQGMNKETALREFVRRIRDKAGSTDFSVVYAPPKVVGLAAEYVPVEGGVRTTVDGSIWSGEAWKWKDWGDFSRFKVYRGDEANFAADEAHYLGQTSDYAYLDKTAAALHIYYYRWQAVNANGVAGPLSDVVQITTAVGPVAVLTLDKTSLSFGAMVGQTDVPKRAVLIRNAGPEGTTLQWTAAGSLPWITVTPTSGTGNGTISVGVNPAGLGAGTYTGQVIVQDPAAMGSPQAVAIELTVFPAGADEPPFGRFDTPTDGANVFSSIPVTGWALDDAGVTKVQIKRHAVPTDPPAALGADGLVFIGDACFVRGTRPDVEALYADYPQSDRAGWGYMLLTNFLPYGGNGTFTLRAIAEDSSGHKTVLGEKVIHVDNAGAVKPFGAIDTPTQGGTASGSLFYNFGWALTPPPNAIPTDGSTIWVWVDSVPLAHPLYNQYRDDIAALFPGYANSNGAVGVYELDTTAYEDGVHNIAWGVRDDAGNEDGVGSRFFSIDNSGGAPSPTALAALLPQGSRRGAELEDPSQAEITIEELGRVRIRLKGPRGSRFTGWAADEGRPLPAGSTLRRETGEFFWNPGPGFLGDHVLHFASEDGRTRSLPITVTIHIVPKSYPARAR